jgi:hypothetical protein
MYKILKYVPLHLVNEYYGQGWYIVSLLGPPHGFYSVLMELVLIDTFND